MRVVIWSARDVPPMDSFEGMSDLFVKVRGGGEGVVTSMYIWTIANHTPTPCPHLLTHIHFHIYLHISNYPSNHIFAYPSNNTSTYIPPPPQVIPEGCAAQETDTHWRAKKGRASWNYRLLFEVELGHNSRAMKFPHLRLQLWDRDVLKWNDCAGETVLNMGRYYRKAYKKNVAVKLFEKKQGAAALRARKAAVAKPQVGAAVRPSLPPSPLVVRLFAPSVCLFVCLVNSTD